MPRKDARKSHQRAKNLRHRFDVVKTLGQGTYGKVKLAIDRTTGDEYAIKSIRKDRIRNDQDLARIRREIEIMASLSHPNIISVYEVYENRDKIILVMEYASGGELYDFCNDNNGLADDEARRFFRQIVSAVHYMHMNGIVHRDLKLENIMLDEGGSVKIGDFGFANICNTESLLSTFCGSPLYASPEIVNGLPYYGPEVDCWSLGVLLYAMVYGAMPFEGTDFRRLRNQITAGDYYKPASPSDASTLIQRLLTPNPARRATIEEICDHWWVNLNENCSPLDESRPRHPVDRIKLVRKLSEESSASEEECHDNEPLINGDTPHVHHCHSNVDLNMCASGVSPSQASPPIKGILKKPKESVCDRVVAAAAAAPAASEIQPSGTGSRSGSHRVEDSIDAVSGEGYDSNEEESAGALVTEDSEEVYSLEMESGRGSIELTSSEECVKRDFPGLKDPDVEAEEGEEDLDGAIPSPVFDSRRKPRKGILKNTTSYIGVDSGFVLEDTSGGSRSESNSSEQQESRPLNPEMDEAEGAVPGAEEPEPGDVAAVGLPEVDTPSSGVFQSQSGEDLLADTYDLTDIDAVLESIDLGCQSYGMLSYDAMAPGSDSSPDPGGEDVQGAHSVDADLDPEILVDMDYGAEEDYTPIEYGAPDSQTPSFGDSELLFPSEERSFPPCAQSHCHIKVQDDMIGARDLEKTYSAKRSAAKGVTSDRKVKGILKRPKKYRPAVDPTWRYSAGSQGSTSSGDFLDFSYDSGDNESLLADCFSLPLSLAPAADADTGGPVLDTFNECGWVQDETGYDISDPYSVVLDQDLLQDSCTDPVVEGEVSQDLIDSDGDSDSNPLNQRLVRDSCANPVVEEELSRDSIDSNGDSDSNPLNQRLMQESCSDPVMEEVSRDQIDSDGDSTSNSDSYPDDCILLEDTEKLLAMERDCEEKGEEEESECDYGPPPPLPTQPPPSPPPSPKADQPPPLPSQPPPSRDPHRETMDLTIDSLLEGCADGSDVGLLNPLPSPLHRQTKEEYDNDILNRINALSDLDLCDRKSHTMDRGRVSSSLFDFAEAKNICQKALQLCKNSWS